MKHRIMLTMFICLLLGACAPTLQDNTEPSQGSSVMPDDAPLILPKSFISAWEGRGDILENIYPDGRIEVIVEHFLYTDEYRVIYVESPYSAYILRKINYFDLPEPVYAYIHLSVYISRPAGTKQIARDVLCFAYPEDWNKSLPELVKQILASDCSPPPEDHGLDL